MRTGSTATGRRLPQEQLPSDPQLCVGTMGHLSGGAAARQTLMEGAPAAVCEKFSAVLPPAY